MERIDNYLRGKSRVSDSNPFHADPGLLTTIIANI